MKTSRPFDTLLLLAPLMVASASLSACGEAPASKVVAPPLARAVSVATITTRAPGGTITASGILLAREEATVGSELSGYRVAKVYAEEGDYVRAGQPLVELDATLLRAQVEQQGAVAAQARAEAQRVADLDDEGVLSQEQIDTRRSQAVIQDAALRELRTRMSRMTITAPVNGLVLQRGVQPGQISGSANTPWFTVARDGLIELEAEVSEDYLGAVRIGQPVTVTLPAGVTVAGSVRLISPRIDGVNRLAKVRVRLAARPDLRPGGYASASFAAAGAPTTVVPEAALRYEASGLSIITVDSENRAHQLPVKIGKKGAGWAQLLQGPPAGTRVVVGGAAFVADGERIRPVLAQQGER